jgi:hypothetical protein
VQGAGYSESEVETDVAALQLETSATNLELETGATTMELETNVDGLELQTYVPSSIGLRSPRTSQCEGIVYLRLPV